AWLFDSTRPIVTGLADPFSTTAHVEYVVSSVGPYRLSTRRIDGCASYTCCTRPFVSASPARFTARTDPGIPPLLASWAIAVGTVLISVTSFAAGSVGSASAFDATITAPPVLSGTNSSNTDKSKQMLVANNTPRSSSAV